MASSPLHDTPAPADPWRRLPPATWALVVGLAILLAYAFRVPIDWMIDRWEAHESYYSHGFLVPFVAGYLIWRDRVRLAELPRGGYWIGALVAAFGLFAFFLSGFFIIFFPGALGLVFFLWGLAGFLFGWRVMLRLWFPALVLLFMVPMPENWISDISFKMKIFAAEASLRVMELGGILCYRDGSTIYLGDAVVTVGNACSGLRSLISLIFLGVLFAHMVALPPLRKLLLFVASFPIAIAANVARVLMLCLIAYHYGNEAITPFVHDLSGYSIFIVAFLLLYGTVTLLSLGLPRETAAAPAAQAAPTQTDDAPPSEGAPHE